ncbi:AmmeMemoRadiSam system protein B [Mariniphaga sediminis]|uniref:MEMO1 family protein D1164_08020 n=1 Tax=Mariniphaga sediminis TaxID=1628158 RepID=A0A399D2B0_9BACT|nr:AmmeMemoRadiSam system protein B [Mariniphaga sediminis]RIH65606.1 AmmeMemoRadiSam system protein B [Mariniphaga sediminis]
METGRLRNPLNREPVFAGKFYPASEHSLKSQLKELFENAKSPSPGRNQPLALISPHAGYVFSGPVAASAFNQIPPNAFYKRVFILASSHQFLFKGAAIFDSGNYKTPLGEVKVDTDLGRELISSCPVFQHNPEAHQFEHSLEVQLPFLQHKLGTHFLLIPIILGTNNPDECRQIAHALKPYFTPENLFVISTDFSHYPEYQDAIDIDLQTARAICSNTPAQLLKALDENKKRKISHLKTSLCGWTSVLTLLYITENEEFEFQKINYQNSGDSKLYGDKNRVVGYWALAVFAKEHPFSVSEEEKKELLQKARHSIAHYLKTGRRNKPSPPETPGILNRQAGVFVSVYLNGELRGCIGNFARDEILNDLVQRMAISAACDYRFKNLQAGDLPEMELEISVLSPLKKITSPDEIELGRHGIYIKKGIHSGTFLPQVAQKTGWSLHEFLGHCSRDKAGLGWDGWKTATLYTFEAVIFRG